MDATASALAGLRTEIDAIDECIGALLALRFEKTGVVGICKALLGESARDEGRQAQRRQFLQAMAQRHGLPADLVADLYGRIGAEVVARHRAAGCIEGG